MSDNGEWDGAERRSNGKPTFERHLQTVFAVVSTAIIVWVGNSVLDLGKEQVRTSTQITQMREDMRTLQEQLTRTATDRYTSGDARRDLQRLEDRIERLERAERREDKRRDRS